MALRAQYRSITCVNTCLVVCGPRSIFSAASYMSANTNKSSILQICCITLAVGLIGRFSWKLGVRVSQVVFSFFSIILLFFFGNQISHSKFSMPYHLVVAPCKDVALDQVQKLQAMPVSSDGIVLHGQVATLPTGQGCKKGDVVQCSIENRETFGQVVRHEQADGACRSLIHVWPQRGSHLEKRSDEGVWVETSCIQGSLTWKTLPGNLVKVVPQKF